MPGSFRRGNPGGRAFCLGQSSRRRIGLHCDSGTSSAISLVRMPRENANVRPLANAHVLLCSADHVACLRTPLSRAIDIQPRVAEGDQTKSRTGHGLDGDRLIGIREAPQSRTGLNRTLWIWARCCSVEMRLHCQWAFLPCAPT
eukprot:8661204-Pyramimonas_sp.AAC.1